MQRWPCRAESYLETDRDRNVRFYEKFGFKIVARSDIFHVNNRDMVRPSKACRGEQTKVREVLEETGV